MSKRFTDNGIWHKDWFVALSPAEKCAFFYVKDMCDAVGVWSPGTVVPSMLISGEIDWDSLPGKCNGNIELLPDGKWWLKDFCSYQYGELRPETCNPHKAYVSLLERHGLLERVIGKGTSRVDEGYLKTTGSLQDKELDKELDNDKKDRYGDHVFLSASEYESLIDTYGKGTTDGFIARLDDYIGSKGKRYKSHYHTVRAWIRKDGIEPTEPICKKHGVPLQNGTCPICGIDS